MKGRDGSVVFIDRAVLSRHRADTADVRKRRVFGTGLES